MRKLGHAIIPKVIQKGDGIKSLLMNVMSKYTLWFMPEGEVFSLLQQTIRDLAERYYAPIFEPHITLIGGISEPEKEVITKTSKLSDNLRPFTVTLGKIYSLDEYYRCLFLRVEETEAILSTNLEARAVFDRQLDDRFMPHLSLMYGEFPNHIKEKIIHDLGDRLKLNFGVNWIHLYSTSGDPEDWYRVRKFPLNRNKGPFVLSH